MELSAVDKKYIRIGIVLLCIISFFPVFTADFVNYDDNIFLTSNPYIREWNTENLKQIFLGKPTRLFVPVTVFTYLIEYTIFGENPAVLHADNLLLHIVNALLLFTILLRLGVKNRSLVLLILVFFALSPLTTESVCWLTERKDVLYCLFGFLSILQFLSWRDSAKIKNIVFSFLFFVLACMSKAMPVSLPILFALFIFYKSASFDLKKYLFLLPFVVVSFLICAISVFRIRRSLEPPLINSYTIFEKLTIFVSEIGYYFFKPWLPFKQQLIFPFPERADIFHNPQLIGFAIAGVVLLISIGYMVFVKKDKLSGFLFLSWIIFLLPVLQIVPNTHAYVSERYFYVSIIFPVTLVWLAVKRFYLRADFFWNLSLLLIPLFVFLTFQRSKAWKNSETLFAAELKMDEHDANAMNNLGSWYNSKGEFGRGEILFKKALTIESNNPLFLNNYGWSLAGTGQTDSALIYFNKALKGNSEFVEALNNIGICYVKKEKMPEAFAYFDRSYKINPDNKETVYNMGAWYLKVGQLEKARPFIKRAHKMGNKTAARYLNY